MRLIEDTVVYDISDTGEDDVQYDTPTLERIAYTVKTYGGMPVRPEYSSVDVAAQAEVTVFNYRKVA